MKIKIICVIISLIFSSKIYCQIIIDLSKQNTSTETIDINLRPVLIVKNMLPNLNKVYKYSFSIEMQHEEIPTISIDDIKLLIPYYSDDSVPSEFDLAYNKLFMETNEINVPEEIDELQKVMKKLGKDNQAKINKGNIIIKNTSYSQDLQFSFAYNQKINVHIKKEFKTKDLKDTAQTWTYVFETPRKSPWHIMYGFTFVPNMMNPVKNYYCEADTSGKKFTITELHNRRNDFLKNISPTIMIQWAPLKKYTWEKGNHCNNAMCFLSNNFYQFGFTAGLSLNFAKDYDNVNVMAGPSIVIADNISLSAGVALTQKKILKGNYQAGQVLKENIDFDGLHESKYMAEWFFSLAIRFDSNPFAKKDEKKE